MNFIWVFAILLISSDLTIGQQKVTNILCIFCKAFRVDLS